MNREKKRLPIGIQTFSKLVEDNYLYVDKTNYIYRLLTEGGQYYFLSRPRRFGKSLLLSTLYELFNGSRHLFKNLWIYDKIAWERHPVIYIDFLKLDYKTAEKLEQSLKKIINKIAVEHQLEFDEEEDYKTSFANLIELLAKKNKNKVIILIDEYDKPIIDFIETEEIEKAKENRKVLKSFYSMLKSSDEFIRFVFITGVSKFSRVSIFSDLNNLYDITVDDKFAALLGITEEELSHYFADRLESLSRKTGLPGVELREQLKRWYNGYSWDGCTFLYNPFSLLNLFSKGRFDNYWFSTGTPTFLINHVKNRQRDIASFEQEEVDGAIFESYDIENLGITSMLLQTGYLSIKNIETLGTRSKYILSYPNEEVKESFLKHFLAGITSEETGRVGSRILDLVKTIRSGNLHDFFNIINSLFASVPSHLFIKDREAYYHTIIYLVLTLIGVNIGVEVHTNKGRIDAVIETGDNIYILEFKMGAASEALKQIETMKYHERYLSSGKNIKLIGVGFDEKERNIAGFCEKIYNPPQRESK